MRWQCQPQPLEQYSLVFGGLGDASAADIDTALGGQHDVDHLYLRDLVEDLPGLLAQTRPVAHLAQSFLSFDAISGEWKDHSCGCETPPRPQ